LGEGVHVERHEKLKLGVQLGRCLVGEIDGGLLPAVTVHIKVRNRWLRRGNEDARAKVQCDGVEAGFFYQDEVGEPVGQTVGVSVVFLAFGS
jgi:hypothetical protein